MCYGFYEESRNSHRIIGHGGDTVSFHSDLHLVLDQKVGFFVSYNSAGTSADGSGRANLWQAFLDRYYPYTVPATTSASAKDDAKAAAGTYDLSRRSENSFLKVASLLRQFSVSPVGDGDIEVPQLTGPNGKPKRWQGVGPMTFLERDGQDKLIFKPDQNGQHADDPAVSVLCGPANRHAAKWKADFDGAGCFARVYAATLILWPVAWFVRRHYGRKLELPRLALLLRVLVRLTFLLDIIFIASLLGLLSYGLGHLEVFSDKGTIWFHLVQVIGVLGAIGTLAALINAIIAWTGRQWSIWVKLQATIMLLACLGLLWFSMAGGLLHFSSTY